MGVLVLSDTVVQLVSLAVVAGLSEAGHVRDGGEGGASQEPKEGAGGVLGHGGRVEESSSGCAVHKEHSHEAPEGSAVEVAKAIAVRGEGGDVSALLILVELKVHITVKCNR